MCLEEVYFWIANLVKKCLIRVFPGLEPAMKVSFLCKLWAVIVFVTLPCLPLLADGKLTEIATVEGITEYGMENGMRVILFPDPSKPTITVNITYLTGSRHEAYGETGMAHLLEHLVFKGTPNHPDIPKELTERGASPNGTTWFDRTNYFETFPSSDDNLEWALDLESDRMVNSFISEDHLKSEMSVVRNEMESGENNPFSMLMQRTLSMAYLWHNYGKSTIGARSDVENVPIERLQAFYRKYYQPDNAVLVVAGKFDVEKAKELILEKFGAIPRPDRSGSNRIYPTYTKDPTQDGERSVTLRRTGDIKLVMVIYHVPPGSHEDFPAIQILSHVLSNAPSGRLHKALVESGKAAEVAAAAYQLREASPLLAYAQVREEGSLEDVWQTMQQTIYQTANETLITDEEVERARTRTLKNIDLMFNSSQSVALQLSEWAAMGDWRLFFLDRDRFEQVSTEDIQRVAATYLKPQNSTVGFFIPTDEPDRAEIPDVPDIAAMVAGYKGREDIKTGEAFDSSPENIESRTTRVTLANGFKLAMLPKETRGGSVNVSMTLPMGNEESLQEQPGDVGSLVGSMLMRGTKRLSRQELYDEFDRLKVNGGVGGDLDSAGGSFQTTRENLTAALHLVAEVLQQPRFDPDQFEELKQELLSGYEEEKSQPRTLGSIALNRHLNPFPKGHPFYVSTLEESIADTEAIELDQLIRFYETFYGAANGHMAVVGDFDPAEIEQVVSETLGDWQAEATYERIPSPHFEVPQEKIVINTPDKANAYFGAGINLPIRDDHEDYPALLISNFMLGGGFLNSRLATRIRQKEGLSYGVGSYFSAGSIDESGGLFAYAIYAPENAEPLEIAFRDEIDKMLSEGFSPDEVAEAQTGIVQYQMNIRSRDGTLANMLSSNLYLDRTMDWTASLEQKIMALSPEEIKAAIRRHIDLDKMTMVFAGDFEKKITQE